MGGVVCSLPDPSPLPPMRFIIVVSTGPSFYSYPVQINERRIQTQKNDNKYWNVSLYSERRRVACRDKALLFMHMLKICFKFNFIKTQKNALINCLGQNFIWIILQQWKTTEAFNIKRLRRVFSINSTFDQKPFNSVPKRWYPNKKNQ